MKTAILGIYKDEEILISALKKLKELKINVLEVYSPYPVHEVFKILERKTRFSYATFLFVLLGLVMSYAFAYWTHVIDYPISYGGKPLHSIPSFIIIGFVSMISMGVLLSFIAFLIRTNLFPGKKPVIVDNNITDDAFVVLIEKESGMSEKEVTRINSLLTENGAVEVIEKKMK